MSSLQVKDVPKRFHDRLRRISSKQGVTLSDFVLRAVERELARAEFAERLKQREPVTPSVSAAEALAEARTER